MRAPLLLVLGIALAATPAAAVHKLTITVHDGILRVARRRYM